jgi:hypothetical protein
MIRMATRHTWRNRCGSLADPSGSTRTGAGMNLMEGSPVPAGLRYGDRDGQDAVSGSRFVNRREASLLKSLRNSPGLQTLTRKTSYE